MRKGDAQNLPGPSAMARLTLVVLLITPQASLAFAPSSRRAVPPRVWTPSQARTPSSLAASSEGVSLPGDRLDGKVAVVTGASRGIGRGLAIELGARGATVYVTGRSTRAGGLTSERAMGVDDVEARHDHRASRCRVVPSS